MAKKTLPLLEMNLVKEELETEQELELEQE
jgi:hypothetical protein